jgi:hypothetical protein
LRPGWFLSRRFGVAKSVGRSSWSLSAPINAASLPVSVLAKRKLLLLFRLVGLVGKSIPQIDFSPSSVLLRLAERNLLGLLFPPGRLRPGTLARKIQHASKNEAVRVAQHADSV